MNAPAKTEEKESAPKSADVKESNLEAAFDEKVVPLGTSEDAVQAFLRGDIGEPLLRKVVGKYGKVASTWMLKQQRDVYDKEIPEDLIDGPDELQTHKEFLETIEEKDKEKVEAMENRLKDIKELGAHPSADKDLLLEKAALERDLEVAKGKK